MKVYVLYASNLYNENPEYKIIDIFSSEEKALNYKRDYLTEQMKDMSCSDYEEYYKLSIQEWEVK